MNPPPADAVIDLPTFTELQEEAGADFVTELVATFIEETPAILAELRSANAQQDLVGFRRAAHSIKSNCHTLGATKLGQMARALELGEPSLNVTAIEALEQEYARVADTLKGLCHG